MSGRIEKELKIKEQLEERIKTMPQIISRFYYWMYERDRSFTTMNNYISYVVDFMNMVTENSPCDDFYKNVTDLDVGRYLISMRHRNVNGKTVELGDDIRATRWSALNTFFTFLVSKRYLEKNPLESTERPKVKTQHDVVYMTPDEIKSVLASVEKNSRPKLRNRDKCIIALGLSTGLRVSAITNIDVSDIDMDNHTIKVIEKGHKTRNIPFSPSFSVVLNMWLNDRTTLFKADNESALFISQKGNRISTDSVRDLVEKYSSHLSKHITPHKLRSSAATNLYEAGVGVATIAKILGHSQITTTQRYVAAVDREREDAIRLLGELIEIE